MNILIVMLYPWNLYNTVHQLCVHVWSVTSDSWDPRDRTPGSSVCQMFQARILEWVAISSSRDISCALIKKKTNPVQEVFFEGFFMGLNHNYLISVFTALFLQFLQLPIRLLQYLLQLLLLFVNGLRDRTDRPPDLPPEKSVTGQQATALDMEQKTGSKLGKEYVKTVYCHPAYLTDMQSTSWETLGWKKHKLELRLWGEISVTSDTDTRWHHPYGRKRRTKEPLDESEKEKWKSWLKTQRSDN